MAKFPETVLAKVEVWSIDNGWEFDIPESKRGRGALSLALDYIVARAKAEQIPVLEGVLISIWSEAHHNRLCLFYADKYGFKYNPDSNRVVKILN
ncbi:MAG: hypothetical protein ACRYG7_48625 [Janthinobacterium lividum]